MESTETGAIRSEIVAAAVRYDLLDSNDVAMRRLAETFAEGFKKYGADNWKKGFKASELWQHMRIHLVAFITGDSTEDNLAHACWNLMALMWVQEKKPELMDYPPSPEYLATLQVKQLNEEFIATPVFVRKDLLCGGMATSYAAPQPGENCRHCGRLPTFHVDLQG